MVTLSGMYYASLLNENANARGALGREKLESYKANLVAADANLRVDR
jgi:hypothetical protein